MVAGSTGNIDPKTVEGFGDEWAAYDQTDLSAAEQRRLFDQYFSPFPFDTLPARAEGFDLGCGSGRWAELVAPNVGRLHCIDPAAKALAVARRRLAQRDNVDFHECAVDDIPLADDSQDFGYSIGVLHHIPDTEDAMRACVRKLKGDAPFLVYLYYAFDNRPVWFRTIWRLWRVPVPLSPASRFRLERRSRLRSREQSTGRLPGPHRCWRGRASMSGTCRSANIVIGASTACGPMRLTGSERGSNSVSPAPRSTR